MDQIAQTAGLNTGRILIVDDDAELAAAVSEIVAAAGYFTETAHDGESAIRKAANTGTDLIVLDINLPDVDGFPVCTTLRQAGVETPILVVSGSIDTSDKVRALQLGADDVIGKPFVVDELLARVAALLRRYQAEKRRGMTEYKLGSMHIDFVNSTVDKSGLSIALSAKENQLLRYLIERRNSVVRREHLLKQVWGYISTDTRTLDVHIATIRPPKGRGDAATAQAYTNGSRHRVHVPRLNMSCLHIES